MKNISFLVPIFILFVTISAVVFVCIRMSQTGFSTHFSNHLSGNSKDGDAQSQLASSWHLFYQNLGNQKKDNELLPKVTAIIAMQDNLDKETLSDAYNLRGNIYNDLNNTSSAISDWSVAVSLVPNDPHYTKPIYFNWGSLYENKRQFPQAIEKYEKALATDPKNINRNSHNQDILSSEAYIYSQLADYHGLENVYMRLIALNPDNFKTYQDRAFFLWGNIAQPQKAIDDYAKAIQLNPYDDFSKLFKAVNENQLGKIKDACISIQGINTNNIAAYKNTYDSIKAFCK